jgi:hypothetical protein
LKKIKVRKEIRKKRKTKRRRKIKEKVKKRTIKRRRKVKETRRKIKRKRKIRRTRRRIRRRRKRSLSTPGSHQAVAVQAVALPLQVVAQVQRSQSIPRNRKHLPSIQESS